eukprot:CFRG0935T1
MANRAKKDPEGIAFPRDSKNGRSTQDAGKAAYAAALAAMDKSASEKTAQEKAWRHGYAKHVTKFVELSAKSPEQAIAGAQAGLDFMHNKFEFIRDGKSMSIAEAMSSINGTFETGVVTGLKSKQGKGKTPFEIPYNGHLLKGMALCDQVDIWVKEGVIEPSTGVYIKAAATNDEWLDLSDKYFVLLGAGSAMGPFVTLTKLNANIIAIDLDRPDIWERLINTVKKSSATITFPLNKPQKKCTTDAELFASAGCNLFTQTPEIKNWLQTVYLDKEYIIGAYAYLDGELHVRVSLAMDAIIQGVCEKRSNVSCAYLNTPTHVYVVPEEAASASLQTYAASNTANKFFGFMNMVSGGKFCIPQNYKNKIMNTKDETVSIFDGIVIAQGPNYALAKQIQIWRAVLEKSRGHGVSSNIAPSTATASVVHNRSFAWAYEGYPYFKPMEIFQQETSNAVMCALLINDVRNPNCNASPTKKLDHPWDIFKDGSFHGGMWRMGYSMNSTGETAAILYFLQTGAPFIISFMCMLLAVAIGYLR